MTSPGGLETLADLRVVELGVWVAAPAAAGLLADWGADVVKHQRVWPERGGQGPAGLRRRCLLGALRPLAAAGWR